MNTKLLYAPWAATTRQGSWDWVVYSESSPNIEICQIFHDGTEENETGEVWAKLVSAAPDMLNALELMLEDVECYCLDPAERLTKGVCAACVAKAAIAKARA